MNKFAQSPYLILLLMHLQFWGCSFLCTKKFPEPILLDADPVMALRYTASEIELRVPLEWKEGPHAADISLLHRRNPSAPMYQSTVFPTDSFRVLLPHSIFSQDSLGNLLMVQPHGGGFKPIYHFFSAPSDTAFEFPTISIP